MDDTNIESATVTISSGYQSSEDVLAFSDANGITGSWDSGTGVLSLSGSATKANYELAFESITYQNTDTDDPENGDRTVTWVVNDGSSNSVGVTSTITVADVNDPPLLTGDLAISVDKGGTVYIMPADLNFTDVDDVVAGSGVRYYISANPSNGTLQTYSPSGGWRDFDTSISQGRRADKTTQISSDWASYFRYVHDDSSTSSDSFQIYVEDGNEDSSTPVSSTINITISAPALNHYAVSYTVMALSFADASGPNCTAIPVTIVAHDVSDSAVTADTTVTLTTSSGNGIWVSNGTSSIDLAFGGATSVTTYLRHTTAGTTTINVTDGTISEGASEDPTYTISAATLDLVFYKDTDQNGVPDGAGDDIGTLTAGSAYNRLLVGVVDGAAACTQDASIANQTLTTRLAYECINPGACIRDKDASAGATAIEDNASGAAISYTDVSLTYSATGFAPFTLTYADAGAIRLHGSVTIPASGNDPAFTVDGISNTFVSKPADLTVTVSGNPGTTSSGSGFVAAGSSFTASIQASNALEGTTPNFGLETPAETAQIAVAGLSYPTISNAGSLNTGSYTLSGLSNGVGTISSSFSEVGSITLQASIGDSDYLGTGNVAGTVSGVVGRFYPNDFVLSADSVLDACRASTNFTYFGQPGLLIDYTITARNAAGATVTHYDASAGYGVATVAMAAEATSNNGTNLTSRLTSSSSSWANGVYTVDDNSGQFSRSTPESELDVAIGVTVTDSLDSRNLTSLDLNPSTSGDCTSAGNCTSKLLTGTAKFRWGRLILSSASGPENQNLSMPVLAEYYGGANYLTNTYDSCTEIARSKIAFNSATIDSTANLTINVGSGTNNSTGESSNRTLNGNDMILSNGDGNLYFTAPSPTATGTFTVGIDASSLSWLLFDWDFDGSHDDSPPAVTGSLARLAGMTRSCSAGL